MHFWDFIEQPRLGRLRAIELSTFESFMGTTIILKDVICLIAIHQFITIYYLKVLVKGPYCQYHILDKSFIKGYGWLLCWRSKGNWSFWGSHQRCCCHASCCWSCYLCCWIITLQWGCRSQICFGGRSQTTFTAMGGGGVRQMSTLLNKCGKFY